MSDTFERNLDWLRDRASAATHAALLHADPEQLDIEVEERDPAPVFRARGDGAFSRALHSPRGPEAEARRQIERWTQDHPIHPSTLIVCLGLGGGYHLRPLAEQVAENGALLLLDPHPRAVQTALHHVDLRAQLGNRRDIRFIVHHDPERLYQEFLEVIQHRPRIDFAFFVHPGVLRVFGDAYRPLPPRLARRVRVDLMCRSTMFNLTRSWLGNAIRNTPRLLDSAPIQHLHHAFTGVPAAVVAAGPSLESALPLLRELQDRMLLISVGTALRPLQRAGIRPHLAVFVDAAPKLIHQLDDVDLGNLRCLVPPQLDPAVLQRLPDRLISFGTSALTGYEDWLDRLGAPADSLRAGCTVTVTAIDAAVTFGCSEVLIFGFDLACRDDGFTHAAHTMWEHTQCTKDELVPVPGNTRPTVLTTHQFATYIEVAGDIVSHIIRAGAPPIFNVTSDGARIPHLPHRLPSSVDPSQWPVRPDPRRVIDTCMGSGSRGSRSAVRKALHKTRRQLSTFAQDAEQAAALCRRAAATGDAPSAGDRRAPDVELAKREKALSRNNMAAPLLNCSLRAESMDTLCYVSGTTSQDERQFEAVHERCATFYQRVAEHANWLRGGIQKLQDDLAASETASAKEPIPS